MRSGLRMNPLFFLLNAHIIQNPVLDPASALSVVLYLSSETVQLLGILDRAPIQLALVALELRGKVRDRPLEIL